MHIVRINYMIYQARKVDTFCKWNQSAFLVLMHRLGASMSHTGGRIYTFTLCYKLDKDCNWVLAAKFIKDGSGGSRGVISGHTLNVKVYKCWLFSVISYCTQIKLNIYYSAKLTLYTVGIWDSCLVCWLLPTLNRHIYFYMMTQGNYFLQLNRSIWRFLV